VPQKIGAKLDNAQVVFMVCDSIKPNRIEVEERPFATDNDGSTDVIVWRADGEGSLSPGDEVKYGESPDGFKTTTGPTRFEPPTSRIWVSFLDVDEFGTVHHSYSGVFDGRKLSEDNWLNAGGSLVQDPCA
jgi:hypothetical protein